MNKDKIIAIVLAAGSGKRMKSNVPKQFMLIQDKPILYYSLKAFEDSSIDEIILVTSQNNLDYCRDDIVKRYGFKKVSKIVCGGKERYNSVANALNAIEDCNYVLIHDGARPFVSKEIITNIIEAVRIHKACVAGVVSKDTIKQCDNMNNVIATPDRNRMWIVQTPQAFDFTMLKTAYNNMLASDNQMVTDDAMVWEREYSIPVKMIEATYTNIKITTPEDIFIGEAIMLRDRV